MKYKFVNSALPQFSAEEAVILDDALQFVMNYEGETPFQDVAFFLSNASKADYVVIGEIKPDKKEYIRSLAMVNGDKLLPNFEYSKKGTPCANVFGQNICYFPKSAQELFPEDKYFQQLNIHSYMGAPLNDKFDNTIGIIALMSSTTIAKPEFLEYLITSISPFLEEKITAFATRN